MLPDVRPSSAHRRRGRRAGPVRRRVATLAAVLVAALVAGCSGGDATPGEGGQEVRASGAGPTSLKDVCPATVVVQTSWLQHVSRGSNTCLKV